MDTVERSEVEEYNAFGPWIDEVRSIDELPRLFRGHAIDFATDRVLKFPRGEARRDLRAGMHLYDHVLVIAPGELRALTRAGDTYSEHAVDYAEVAAITDSVDLLDGHLSFQTRDGVTFSVAYNGSSRLLVATIVDVIRERTRATSAGPSNWIALPPPEQSTPLLLEMDDLGKKDVALVSLFNEVLRAHGDVRLIAAQGRQNVAVGAGPFQRAIHLMRPMTLHGLVLCGSGSELQILSRRNGLVRGVKPETSISRTVLSADKVEGVSAKAHPKYPAASVVIITAGAAQIEVVVAAGSAAEHALLAL